MKNTTIPASIFFSFFLMLSCHSGAAEAEKIGVVMECESISRLITDTGIISKALGMKVETSRIETMLDNMSASAGRTGISSNKPFRIFVVTETGDNDPAQAGTEQPDKPVVLVFPLTDNGDTYLKSVGSSYEKKEKAGILTHFSGPAEQCVARESDFYVGIADNQAVTGTDAAKVELVLAHILPGKPVPGSVPGTLKIFVDVAAIMPSVEKALKNSTETMKQAFNSPAATNTPMTNPGQILMAESELFLAIMKQLKTCSYGIGVKDNAIEINSLVAPVAGGQLEAITRTLVPPSGKYTCALSPDAFISTSGNGMNVCDIFIEPYCKMMDTMFDAADPDGKFKTKMRDTIISMKGAFSGEYSIGVIPGASTKDMALVEVIGVNDAAKFRKNILDALNTMKDMYSTSMPLMSMTFEKTRTSGGVEVIPYTCSVNQPAGSPPQASPLMNLGKNYRAEMACVDNAFIYTMGGGTAVMDKVIERLKTAGNKAEPSKAFATLFPTPPDRMISTYSIELGRLIKAFMASLPNSEQMIQMIPDSRSGVAGYSVLRGNDIAGVTRIGFEEIECIRSSLMPLGLMMMTSTGGTPGAQANTPRGSPESKCIRNLRMLGDAKEQCALEKNLKDGDTVEPSALTQYLLRGKMPVCPEGGTYTLNPIGKTPTCSIPAHKLKN